MLEVISLSHQFPRQNGAPRSALDSLNFSVPKGHLLGVLGAKDSGKSILLSLLAGDTKVQTGAVLWNGRDIGQQPLAKNDVGFVASDEASLQPLLSVKEHIVCAMMLNVGGWEKREFLVRADKLMALCGLDAISGQRVESIATPQRRRLALAIALATEPQIVICDAFTDGVDAKSERELGALLQSVARAHPARVVINATPTLGNLNFYDTVLTLHDGCVCFHGPGRAVTHYFSIPHIDELYQRLAMRPVQRWQESWNRHRDSYYAAFKLTSGNGASEADLSPASDDDGKVEEKGRLKLGATKREEEKAEGTEEPQPPQTLPAAGMGAQIGVLLNRRMTIFRRSKAALWTQLAMIIGAPIMSIAFASSQLEAWKAMRAGGAPTDSLGAYISGLFLIQVLIVIAMAVHTCARELANERPIWQREHRAGLSAAAYLVSKAFFVLPLLLAQSIPMTLFVEAFTGGMPGNGPVRVVLFTLTSVAMAALSLGISAWSANADRAASRSWLLAFAQAPLSGALIALPSLLASVVHPFVTGFYGWSGCMDSMHGTPLFDAATKINATWFATPAAAMFMLLVHIAVGSALVLSGLRKR